jgi:hypothetical protein
MIVRTVRAIVLAGESTNVLNRFIKCTALLLGTHTRLLECGSTNVFKVITIQLIFTMEPRAIRAIALFIYNTFSNKFKLAIVALLGCFNTKCYRIPTIIRLENIKIKIFRIDLIFT